MPRGERCVPDGSQSGPSATGAELKPSCDIKSGTKQSRQYFNKSKFEIGDVVTVPDDATWLRKEAARCRRLASGVADTLTCERLTLLACEYDQRATALGRPGHDSFRIVPKIRG
jgi:hypothetical protein